jgi:hypothetical protein
MRVDLIPERDRFIPGWHTRHDTSRAESIWPESQWPFLLCRTVQAFLGGRLRGLSHGQIHWARVDVPKD